MTQNLVSLGDVDLSALKSAVEKRASSSSICKPIFHHDLNAEEWKMVQEYAAKLNADYEQRAQLTLKRLDVTIDAFLWSDRTKKLKDKVMEVYTPARDAITSPLPVNVDDLLSATTDLLLIEKASSKQVRLSTCNEFCAYTVKNNPKDRGGRTTEMIAPPPDAPYWLQQKQQQSQQRRDGNDGGRRGGGGFFQQYRGQRNDHVENQVRQHYNPYHRGGDRTQQGRRGRGGGGPPRHN